MADRCLIFDESGNMGTQGRYFVIACIDTYDRKALHNIMKRKLLQAKKLFPELSTHANEIKAAEAYPCIKYHLLECIATKNLNISYIVADLKHVDPTLLKDKNLLYNYIMKILIDNLVCFSDKGKKLNIVSDNKTLKVPSKNSFEDYIKIHLNYERKLNMDISVRFLDSDAIDAYIVQAADYVANAIYTYYEYNNADYFNQINGIINVCEKFPRTKFGR